VGAYHADGLLGIIDFVSLRVVAIAAQAVAEDDGVDAVVVEEGDEVRALAADVQRVVSATRGEDNRGASVDAALDRVDLDRRVVNADDAADTSRHRLAHAVHLGLADLVFLEVGRIRRPERDHDTALQDGLRSVRSVGGGCGFGHAERRRDLSGRERGDSKQGGCAEQKHCYKLSKSGVQSQS
jgi:hypothetical protein